MVGPRLLSCAAPGEGAALKEVRIEGPYAQALSYVYWRCKSTIVSGHGRRSDHRGGGIPGTILGPPSQLAALQAARPGVAAVEAFRRLAPAERRLGLQ